VPKEPEKRPQQDRRDQKNPLLEHPPEISHAQVVVGRDVQNLEPPRGRQLRQHANDRHNVVLVQILPAPVGAAADQERELAGAIHVPAPLNFLFAAVKLSDLIGAMDDGINLFIPNLLDPRIVSNICLNESSLMEHMVKIRCRF
jgi:hypothetical protein